MANKWYQTVHVPTLLVPYKGKVFIAKLSHGAEPTFAKQGRNGHLVQPQIAVFDLFCFFAFVAFVWIVPSPFLAFSIVTILVWQQALLECAALSKLRHCCVPVLWDPHDIAGQAYAADGGAFTR